MFVISPLLTTSLIMNYGDMWWDGLVFHFHHVDTSPEPGFSVDYITIGTTFDIIS